MYICVTHVDSRTKIPGNKAPMKNGPVFPDVKGLNIEWWDESNWPLTHPDAYPQFYGTCDDDADTDIPGVISVFEDQERETEEGTITVTAEEQYNTAKADEERARLPQITSPVRLKLALLQLGLLDEVVAHFNTYDEEIKTKIGIIWENSNRIAKEDPIVEKLAAGLGWSQEKVDDIFVIADELLIDPWYVEPTSEEEAPE